MEEGKDDESLRGKWNWSGLSKERHDHFDLYGSKTILKSVHFTSQWVHK